MNNIKDLLVKLKNDSIDVVLSDGELEVFFDGDDLDEGLYDLIKSHKSELIQYLSRGTNYRPITRSALQESYPLTSSQRRLWILSQLEGGSLAYNMPFAVRLQGSFSLDKFRHAFAVLIDRHEILRTVFRSDAHGDIRQYILDAGECGFHIDYADYSMHGDAQQRAEDYLQASNSRPFDLASGPLLGACVLCLGPDEHVFFLSMHHIISDGWSIELLASEVIKVYNSLVHGVEADLPSLPIQYKDYAVWLNESFSDPSYQSSDAYWREQFSGELPVLELPGFKGRPLVQSYRGDILTQHFSAAFLERIKSFSARHDATLFMGLLSGVKALLHRYSAQQDIIIGTPIAGREHPDLEGQLGLYVNTLAIRTRFDAQENFSGLLDKERSTLLGAYEHQSYPFDELVGQLNFKRDTGRSPLFDVTITLQSQSQLALNTEKTLSGLQIDDYEFNYNTSKFDLSFVFVEGDGLSLSIQYNTDIYDRWLIERMFGHFERLVTGMLDSPSQYIGTIDYLSAAEREQVVYGFNATSAEYGSGKTVVDLFEAQALQAPDSIAVVFEGSTLTYGKLNERSNQLAGYLRSAYGISGDDFVGVKLPRSEKMIVAILGILKAGGAYVPIDTAYPADRIAYMEQDSNCRVVLDEEELMLFDFERFRYPVDNLAQSCTPSSLAYLIYTSGSTGRPKGVMVEHGNIVRLVQACHYFTLDSSTVLLSTGSVSFDATILEFFGTLLNGGKLILTADLLDLSATGSLMGEQQVNSLWMTASWFNDVVDSHIGFFENIRQLIVGGDVVSEAHVRKVFAHYPSIRIINGYGPTENTTFSATYEITDREYGTTIPIGRPISNSQVYVLDSSLLPVPVGIAGRLYVSGAGVARGYLHNAELTAARFLSDPFLPGQRMYDTGDLGRWHSDGTLEFMGRADHQVKIRGFRVEPGEVEHAIYGYGGDFEQVVVHALEHNGEKVLAAYLVGPSGVDKPALRSYLLSVLPEYMVPGFYIELDYLPLNPNGKTDRSRLPGISDDDVLRREYIAPSSALEQDLALIWQDVLGLERVGMRDNFFELGGHSLVMVQVINRISRQLGRSISFGGFFGNPTIEGLIGELRGQEYKAIVPAGLQESYPLTSSQRRLWILSQLEGGSLAYNMPFAVRLQGSFSLDKFRHAFAVLIDRHEILRTVFRSDAHGDIRQYILDAGECGFHIDYADYSMHGDAQQRAEDYLQASNSAFDLASGPLLGACVLCLGPDEHVFFLSMHHIISDGWSIELLASEVIKVYNSLVHGVEADLPSLPIQYKDYAVWLNESFSDPSYQSSGSYWREQFSGELPVLELPGFKGRPLVQSYRGDILTQHFSAAFLERIKSFSARHDATLFMGLLSGVKALLHRYSAQQDIIIGTPIAGREHPDLEGQLGLYLNTLAIRTRFDAQENFSGLLDKERSTLLGAYEHQSYPFDELVGQLNLKRDTGRSPLFDVWVVLQSQAQLSLNTQTDFSGLRAEGYDFNIQTSQFDLSFNFMEGDGLSLSIQYNTDIYDRWLIERMFGHFERLVTGMLDSPSQYIGTIDYLSAAEREQVVYGFNATSAEYGSGKTVVDLFEAQALQAPDSIAVVFEGSTLTYGKLNERSNQLAGYLRSAYGISGDDFVGVKLPRSEKMIVAILGILKAGGAYVPIDTAYPADRIAYMEQDSNCRVVLDEEELMLFDFERFRYPVDNLAQSCTPSSLAYLIYTSGSTGRPKGVMVEHGNLYNYIKWASDYYFEPSEQGNFGLFSSLSFDLTVTSIFIPLIRGGLVKIMSSEDTMDNILSDYISGKDNLDAIKLTPSHLELLKGKNLAETSLKRIIIGGESLHPDHVLEIQKKNTGLVLYNEYGPTESTVGCTVQQLADLGAISIGRPISNSQVYVLDSSLLPVPVGIAGRLYVSGAGVARGYLHNAELTAARFLSDPFLPGQRMYDTGDLGRWHSDGTLEFMGRADHQVKIRGFRVEPGEVEHAIYGYGGDFEQVVVHALEHNGEKVLAAYLVGPSGVDKPALRSYLLSVLPEYMVPGFYIELDYLPLNPNGKTDRSRLPGISDDDVLRREYIAPSSALEQDLALIWQDVLGLERVGMRDNFFELGGHSLVMVQVINRISRQLGRSISFGGFFGNPTIEGLIGELRGQEYKAIVPAGLQESYPLTSSQRRLWILSQLEGGSLAYNMPFAVRLQGSFSLDKFRHAFAVLIDRHEILRTVFRSDAHGDIRQYILDAGECGFHIDYADYSMHGDAQQRAEDYLQASNSAFDLASGPLLGACVLCLGPDEHVFFLSMHHIISDGWSIELLASEVIKVYNSLVHGVEADLPSLPIQYKDYAVWLNESFSDPSYQSSGSYWREQFSGELPVLELPGFKGRPLVQSYRGDILTQHFSAAFLERIKSFSARHDATLFMGLLSGVKALLHRYSAQQDIIIGTPIAGREHPDLEGQLGLYLNTLAIRTRFDAQENFSGLLDKERSTLLGAYEHQSYPFDELVGQLNLKRDTGRSPLFDVWVVLQSQAQLSLNTQTDFSGLRAEGYDFNIQTSQFDLSFNFMEGDGLSLSIQYNTDIYDRWLIERMFGHFERLVTGMLDSPSQYIGTIDYLSAAEREQVVYGFNATSAEYGSGKTVVDLFEAQALQAPDSIAVVFEGSTLTYGKLNERSNQLAGYLRSAYGISGDDFVGVKLPRSEKMIVAILGILKAGGAYVPIDTAYPADRIAYMEQDSNCRVVLDEEELMLFDFERFRYPVDNLAQSCTPSSLAYLIYTSGSTGRPKGVMVEHGNLYNYIKWASDYYFEPSEQGNFGLFSSLSFDLTVTSIFIPLIRGGLVKIMSSEDTMDNILSDYISGKDNLDAIKLTPSHLELLKGKNLAETSLKRIIIGGESLHPDHVLEIQKKNTGLVLYNEYGPTESTVGCTVQQLADLGAISIGRPISNSQVYVLDSSLLPVPVGIAGRLYVSGAGVARGYLHNAELTAARFLSDPFLPGQRMYDTGDLGRWHSDGTLEFMGRADHQVKIRGFRVEPGEVEHAIYGYGGDFEQVVVHALEHNGEKVLAAYLVGPSGVDKPALRSYLLSVLPEYMVPGFYIELDHLPLNPNGKTDRSRLPGISDDDVLRREYIAPSSALEQDLALIWQDVLGLERVGMRDNFFELGGHSLVMVQVINRISRQLGRSISFGGFFGNPTIEGLIGELRGQEYKAIVPAGPQESYPLTSSQRRLWILSQLEGGSLAYNMPFAVRLQGSFSLDKFRHAFAVLIDRHEILRTVFRSDAHGDIRQYILDAGECGFHIDYADYSMHGDAQQRAEDYLQASNSAFDLASGPLLGACVLCLGPDEHVFFLSMHHIISDGWSIELLASEVIKVYNSLVHGVEADLPSLPIQYKDYAVWLNESFSDPSYQSSGSYWREQFSGELPVLELPGFKGRPLVQSYRGDILTQHFSAAFLERLKSFSARHDATLFMGLLSGVKALLHRYSAQQDIIIGTPIAGREHPDLEGQLGLYLNTLAIRTRFDAQENFSGLLDKERSTLLGAYEHQSYPFDELVGQLNLKRDTGRSPLFDVTITLQSQAQLSLNTQTDLSDLSGLRAEGYDFNIQTSQFDLSFIFVEGDGLSLSIQYNTDIYDRWLIERMFGHFERLVTGMLDSPSQYIGTIDYLSAAEREQVVYGFNATSAEYGSGKTVVDLFEAQALQAPDSIAVVFEGSTLTYGKLNERSNQLAGYLRSAYGISGDDFVGVKLPRSEKMIVAILGILKAGGAYVPIDTAYPADRIAYMEQDSNCRVVLDEEELMLFDFERFRYPVDNLAQSCTPSSLAYLIYTSGSTGRPKGVMVEHGNIVRLVQACHYFTLDSSTVLLSTGSVSFDATILEFFGTLLNGGKLILTADLLDLSATGSLMGEQQVNSLWMTASWFNDVVDSHIGFFENIRQLIVGGDVVSEAHVRKVFAHYPSIRIINGYGPTENTTFSATYEITDREYGTTIPIGRPISNSQVYVLDSSLLPVPVGIAGRLYVSGAGVARGYLHNAELTAARFLSDPFLPGQRMYDTGDLGRWHSDGTLEFMGRADHQVKIRGFRVEPGEVEHAIYGYGGDFEQVVVHALEHNGEKVLAAYLVGPSGVDKPALRSYLLSVLPEYMVPGFYIELDYLPLNPNGKTDRSRLPGISDDDVLRREYIAPSSALEQDLALIWQDVLGLERVGMRDNFFELGGHSLVMVQVINRISRQLGRSISFGGFFGNPTIEGLIGELRGQEYKAIVPAGLQESYPLTSSQRRLWILSQLEGGSLAYNMPFAVRLQGSFSLDKFRHAFAVLIDRHEILRTVFRSDAHGDIRQYILDAGECGFHIDYADYSMHGDAQQRAEDYLQASNSAFDLASGPLLGACVLCLGPDEHVFFLSMHHIISDGWSIELLASEVIKVYNSLVHGVEADLPSLPIQYKDYAVWLNESFSDPSYQSSGSYWREQFSGELPVLELPGFKGRPLVQSYRGDILTQHFSAAFLERIKSFSARHDATLFMGLLSGVKALLHRYSAQQDIIIGTPIAGREHPDLEGQLGLYLNTLAIRTRFDAQENFSGLLDKERSTLLGAYEHQSYPFDELVGQLNLKRDTGRSPLFDVMVVLQSQAQLSLNTQTDLSGLRAESYAFRDEASKFDLNFIFVESDGLSLSIQYNTDIYDRWLIERMFGHFERLVTGMLDSPSQYIGTIDYLSATEREQVVYGFNATSAEYGSGKTVVDLFEAQALQAPDSIAVVFEGSTLTYGKLNERSNQLAGYLRSAYGISGDDFVGVKLPRSEKMIVAILGILKAGGAYVPIDTAYPADRIAYMEQDSNCRVVLDEGEWDKFTDAAHVYPVDNLAQSCTPSSLAYLIYTSGSTGRPKGVMVEHGNIVRLVQACHYFTLDSSTVLLSTGSVSFDATILEFFGTLLNGGKLILTADLLDLSATGSLMGEQQVNSLWMTASWFNDVVDSHIGFFENIRQLIVGGDVVSEAHVRKVFAHYPSIRIINGYGPTENTTFSATYEITDREYGTTIPIGRPISNSQAYVLDSSLLPVPVGIAGRLYVSGAGVARGYLHNAELTAARFLSDPFLPGQRMYDTGDLGRWHSDGTLEFMGRADHQVKIRGFRVEPGEVEHAIYGYGGDFEQVVVHALEHNGEKVLAAYLVGPSGVDKPALRSYLLSVLPEYMVPGFYIELDHLPLNPNGKTDRSRLPGISDDDVLRREYIAPSSALEQDLALIWQDVLGLERVGMRDNFFELGGHSMAAIKLVHRMNEKFNISFTISNILVYPTIEKICRLISILDNSQSLTEQNNNEIYKI